MDQCKIQKRKTNPREEANIFSLLTFGYTLQLFKTGFKKDLEEEDLYEVLKNCRSKKCGDKTEEQWNKSWSILRLLWTRFGVRYVTICLICIAWKESYSILQPYGMSRLISYFEKNQTKISKTEAYYCAGLVVFLKVFSFIFWQNFSVYEYTFGTKIRASLKSLLYRKALKLSPASFSDTNLGNIVIILTKDIHVIEHNLWLVMDLVICILQTLTLSYLIWAKLGNTAFIGLGLLFLAIPIQLYMSTWLTKMCLKVGKHSDERIQVTQETLSAIKIIKMYTWEKFFNKKISESRNNEVIIMMKAFYIHFVIVSIGIITSKITFPILILAYIWMGYTTSTEIIFYVLSCFHELTRALGIIIPISMSKAAEFRASFIRLNKLLQAEEVKMVENCDSDKASLELKDVSVKFKDKIILNNISLKINNLGLTLVTGPVGSGKSSLLKTILQDYPISKGYLQVLGSVSYASQDPWLFPGTIKQNILFGQKYEADRYREVVRVCALNYDLSLLEYGDETVVADRGINLSKGQQSRINLARAVYKKSNIYLFDDSLTALDRHVQDYIFTECVKNFLHDKICVLVTQNVIHMEQANDIVVMDQGRLFFFGKPEDIRLKNTNGLIKKENATEILSNEEKCEKNETDTLLLQSEQQYCRKKIYHETKKTGKVEFAIYKKYFEFGGGFLVFFLIILLFIIAQVCESSADKLITKWIDLQQKVLDLKDNSTINETYYEELVTKKDDTFGVYGIMVIIKSILGLVKFYALLRFCRNASINIHKIMSLRIINGVMSFFDTHFIGNILNRFSHDLSNIDEHIPFVFPGLISVFFSAAGGVVLVATVNWLFLIPALIFFIILVLIRMVYIPTGRSLKRLEAATRSPLVGHINSSLEGLTTIRAFKAQQILKDEFDRHQDLYTSAYFTLLCTMTALEFFMDCFSSTFTILVVVRFVFFDHDISAGNVGLALTQVFMLTSHIQWGIRQWSLIENDMTSVERTLEFTTIEQESSDGNEVKNWPKDGAIKYDAVSLRYESAKEPVLKNISFFIEAGQKIGIVGRTGAGKSSIISTLFRLYTYEGKILIDGVDISSLSLSFLRKNIAIIPQDPILFSGTIRDNIDPNRNYTDAKIWQAIEKVKIKELISSLDMEIKEGGSSFSSGQKQLICLARAAVGKYKIVVLDEATANMDSATDEMLHKVIDEIFSKCTILTIAHRLHFIKNSDKVMVLDSGKLAEFDSPKKLLEDTSSLFYRMCKETDVH